MLHNPSKVQIIFKMSNYFQIFKFSNYIYIYISLPYGNLTAGREERDRNPNPNPNPNPEVRRVMDKGDEEMEQQKQGKDVRDPNPNPNPKI